MSQTPITSQTISVHHPSLPVSQETAQNGRGSGAPRQHSVSSFADSRARIHALCASEETAEPLPWYALRTKSNQERLAACMLENKGYEVYLPVYHTRRRWSDREVETDMPLFPGYLFCRFDAKSRLPILMTPGIVSVVGCGNEPAPVPDRDVEAVKAILRSGAFVEPCPFLHEGQRIRINRGSFQGLEGFLLQKKNNWRMVVSVSMLQRSVSVEIDREWIIAV